MRQLGDLTYSAKYLAGVFDSDGGVSIVRVRDTRTRRGHAYKLSVYMTGHRDDDLYEQLKAKFGGSVYYPKTDRAPYWMGHGSVAGSFLDEIHNYVLTKIQQVDIAYRFANTMGRRQRVQNGSLSESIWHLREHLYHRMKRQHDDHYNRSSDNRYIPPEPSVIQTSFFSPKDNSS